jgi:hypothetical protein
MCNYSKTYTFVNLWHFRTLPTFQTYNLKIFGNFQKFEGLQNLQFYDFSKQIIGKKVVSLYLIEHYAMKTWGSGGIAPTFLTLALEGGEWSASRPGRFTPGEIATGAYWLGWVGPRAGLDAVEKRKILPLPGI